MYRTVVRGLSGAPLYLTREGRRVDGTYENKPTNRKEQLKKSPQPTKETSAWHRPRKNNNRIKYQKSWCVTARLFHPLLGWYRAAINSHHELLTRQFIVS